ncbi:glycosyl transferase, partial [Citrobacter sp. AAK_AS5]
VYDRAEDVPFDALPQAFVLKTTHASGWNVICKDRRALAVEAVRARLRRWLARSYYLAGREWSYKHIRPRIVCERYL